MDLLRKDQINQLIERQGGPCVSIYMSAHRAGQETRQDPIRFKNQLKRAEEQLTANGVRAAEARQLLEPAQKLLRNFDFWQNQADGLAVFAHPDKFEFYRLPLSFNELVVVTDRFHLKPLLRMFTGDGNFFVLALSQNQIRLFQCTQFGNRELELPAAMPKSLAEAMKYEEEQPLVQFHTRAAGTTGERSAMWFGHGGYKDVDKNQILRFFQAVDRALQDTFRDQRAPLVLAGVEFLFPIYREANTYSHLLEVGITGNPEGKRPEELQREGWEIVEPLFQQGQKNEAALYNQLAGTERASDDLEQIVANAHIGRVQSVFVPVGMQQWGSYHPEERSIELHKERQPGDQDLLDFAAIHTYLHGGAAYAVDPDKMPAPAIAAAVYRY